MGENFYDYTYEELYKKNIDPLIINTDALTSCQTFNFEHILKSQNFYNYWQAENNKKHMLLLDNWCKEHLLGFFKIDNDRSSFQQEDDAMAFKLRWI